MQQSKIAAGIEVCYTLRFKPDQAQDYEVDLVCCTEREKFLVPVRAIGPKPKLNIPAEVSCYTTRYCGKAMI